MNEGNRDYLLKVLTVCFDYRKHFDEFEPIGVIKCKVRQYQYISITGIVSYRITEGHEISRLQLQHSLK